MQAESTSGRKSRVKYPKQEKMRKVVIFGLRSVRGRKSLEK